MAITFQQLDRVVADLAGITSGGGTATVTYALPTDCAVFLFAKVLILNASASHLNGSCCLQAEMHAENKNGTCSAPGAVTGGGINPGNSTTVGFLDAHAQGSDINSGTPTSPTAAWTVSGTNGVLTVTNNFSASVDAMVWIDAYIAKNV